MCLKKVAQYYCIIHFIHTVYIEGQRRIRLRFRKRNKDIY